MSEHPIGTRPEIDVGGETSDASDGSTADSNDGVPSSTQEEEADSSDSKKPDSNTQEEEPSDNVADPTGKHPCLSSVVFPFFF